MDPTTISTISEILAASGPYGIVAIAAVGFYKLTEKKDRELRSIYERFIELSEQQVAATARVEAALVALREVIVDLKRTLI